MYSDFLFSSNHLILLIIFIIFFYISPKLTKNLLPYSYIVEKIVCGLIILEIVFEQVSLVSMGSYDVFSYLPINISRFSAYLCIGVLFFKKYHWFDVFFSWSIVCSIGEMVLFKDMPYRYPNILYFLYFFSHCLLLYVSVYLIEVRKFKISNYSIRNNLILCSIYFLSIFLINYLTGSQYDYCFSSNNIASIILFILSTNLIYFFNYISNKEKNY